MTAYADDFADVESFLRATMLAGVPGGARVDVRLQYSAGPMGLDGTPPSNGGFLMPAPLVDAFFERIASRSTILSQCFKVSHFAGRAIVPMLSGTERNGGVVSQRTIASAEIETSTPKFTLVKLDGKPALKCAIPASGEICADASQLAPFVDTAVMSEIVDVIEGECFTGSGAGTALGIANSPGTIIVPAASGQSSATVLAENLLEMASRLFGPSHAGAAWYISNDVFRQIAGTSFSDGNPVLTEGADGERRILQMPVHLTEHTAILGQQADVCLCDWSQYGVTLPPQVAVRFSAHNRFATEEGIWRFSFRFDGLPMWSAPVTPRNSATTQSPFVAMAARP